MRIALFGLGFVGRALAAAAEAAGHEVLGFSRSRGMGAGAPLDASQEAALAPLDGVHADGLVVTFPPAAAHPRFWEAVRALAPRRILLGSTSIYDRASDCSTPVITEQTPLAPLHPRRPAEEAFCAEAGHVVRLAGLYGGPRNPARWIRDGRVGREKRQANLVHQQDVATALLGLLTHPGPLADVYNLADGQRHTWREIVDALVSAGAIDPRPAAPSTRGDAFVAPDRIRTTLPHLRFRDFWSELERLAAELPQAAS